MVLYAMDAPQKTTAKWYDRKWLVWTLIFFVYPVGMYALGANNSMRKVTKAIAGVISTLFFIGAVAGPSEKSDTDTGSQTTQTEQQQEDTEDLEGGKEEIVVHFKSTASGLVNEYEQNEVAADEKLKGKNIIVTGIVDNISKDIMGDPFVVLRGDGLFRGVQCTFRDNSVLSELRKGQQVQLVGKCEGLFMNVQMTECVLMNY